VLLVQDLTGSKIGLRCGDALLGSGVGEQFRGGLDGLEIFGSEEHDVFAAVAGDLDTLVRAPGLVSDLRRGTGESGQAKSKNSADCSHFHRIAHWGPCGKSRVVPQNLRPKPEPAEIRIHEVRVLAGVRCQTVRSRWPKCNLSEGAAVHG
jgi:hypothetical protein